MNTLIIRFVRDTRAAAAIEYALVAGLISVAIVAGAVVLGGALATTYEALPDNLPAAE